MNNQSTNQKGNSMMIKCLMVTVSNEDPRSDDGWVSAYDLDLNKEYSFYDLVALCQQNHRYALWVYHGEEFENKYTGEQYFYPWDRPECLKLVRPACILVEDSEDSFMEDWRREIAMEEGMLQGIDSYNDWMGY